MREERLNRILELLFRYEDMKNTGDIIDYYQLFGFRKAMFLEEIKIKIHNLKLPILFHPDQVNYIPEEYREKYVEMVAIVQDMLITFDTVENRKAYDQKLRDYVLEQSRRMEQIVAQEQLDKSREVSEKLKNIILCNSEKYSFTFTRDSLLHFLKDNSPKGFTRDYQGINLRVKLVEIGREKTLDILTGSTTKDITSDPILLGQVVMNYLTDIIYQTPKYRNQVSCLGNACIATMQRVENNIYLENACIALKRLASTNDFFGFENKNHEREELINSNINLEDLNFLIECSLNNERNNNNFYAYQNIKRAGNLNFYDLYCQMLTTKIKKARDEQKEDRYATK